MPIESFDIADASEAEGKRRQHGRSVPKDPSVGDRIRNQPTIIAGIVLLVVIFIIVAKTVRGFYSSDEASNAEAHAAAARVSEAAVASWDLVALPCVCDCPAGTPAQPPRDQIVQSASDSRQHRSVTLPGGLRAFLTSDPATDFAAASVDVGVGSADDPKDFQGLAHFLEHMLFMGTEKYPSEDEYSKFVAANGGYDNAYTGEEHTNFYFSVRHTALPDALDRFAQFFAFPLLNEASASREVEAVNAEHQKNLNNDGWRVRQVRANECGGRPNHFGTGNQETLKGGSEVAVNALKEFHSQNYVADNLRLSISGKESLDDLEKLARAAFKDVRQGTAPAKNLGPLPGPQEGVCAGGSIYVIRPRSDLQSLTLSFPAREMRSEEMQRSAARSILSAVIDSEHEGGLYADLKRHGWATSLSFGVGIDTPDSSTLELSVELTKSGLDEIIKVVDMALGHLRLAVEALEDYAYSLKASDNSKDNTAEVVASRRLVGSDTSKSEICGIWTDIEAIRALHFHFQEKSDPASFVSAVAATLHSLPPRDVLASFISLRMDAEVILSITKALDSRHKLPSLWVISKEFDGGDILKPLPEPTTEVIYGTTYLKGELPLELVSRWKGDQAPQPPDGASLPTKMTEFLPVKLKLQPVPADGAGLRKTAPADIIESHYRLLHKPDAEYRVPKSSVRCFTATPEHESAAASEEAFMLSAAVGDALETSLFRAGLAGYGWTAGGSGHGFSLSVAGYEGEGIEHVARSVAAAFVKPEALPEGRFEALLARHKRAIRSQREDDLYSNYGYLAGQALLSPMWTWEERLIAAESVTWEAAVKRGQLIQSASALTCLAHGDISKAAAQRIAAHLAPALSVKALPLEQAPLTRITALPKQHDFTDMRSPPLVAGEKNSLVVLVYQLEPSVCEGESNLCAAALQQAAAMMMLGDLISPKAFDQLRTKGNLGIYVVWAWVQPSTVEKAGGNSVWSLRLLVQSGTKSASVIRERMTKFLDGFVDECSGKKAGITDADIELSKKGLVALLLKRPNSLGAEGGRIWSEVLNRRGDWTRPWELAKVVPKLTRKDITEVLDQVMRPGQAGRRASLQVWRSEDGDPFANSNALHLDDAASMRKWKEKVGSWSTEL